MDFLACGLDPQKAVLFRQSDVPEVTELTWLLSCLTPMPMLENGPMSPTVTISKRSSPVP